MHEKKKMEEKGFPRLTMSSPSQFVLPIVGCLNFKPSSVNSQSFGLIFWIPFLVRPPLRFVRLDKRSSASSSEPSGLSSAWILAIEPNFLDWGISIENPMEVSSRESERDCCWMAFRYGASSCNLLRRTNISKDCRVEFSWGRKEMVNKGPLQASSPGPSSSSPKHRCPDSRAGCTRIMQSHLWAKTVFPTSIHVRVKPASFSVILRFCQFGSLCVRPNK